MTPFLRLSCLALLGLTAVGPVVGQSVPTTTSPTTVPSALPAAADLGQISKPLVDFASWCAAKNAKSAGDWALAQAKKISDAPPGIEAAALALSAASDDASDSPAVETAKQAAIDAVANELAAAANGAVGDTDRAVRDGYLLKALRISPRLVTADIAPAAQRAVAGDTPDAAVDWYAALVLRNSKIATSLEPKLQEKNLLPKSASRATAELMVNDRPLDALSYLTALAKRDAKGFAAGKYQPCTDVLAAKTFLIRSAAHPIVAYMSIPWKWNPARTAPVVFCFAGAGKEFKGVCDSFHSAIGDGPFIVVSPVTFSNTNGVDAAGYRTWYKPDIVKPYASPQLNAGTITQRLRFDQPGILALFREVQAAANTESQMYITGFSGGGMPCYATMIETPNLIAAAAPACANFYLSLVARGNSNGAKVQQFFGEKDPFNAAIGNGRGLIAQGQEAALVLSQMGYDVAQPTMVHDAGHSELAKDVVAFFKNARLGRNNTDR